mgnify:CR=1 FL=1
MGVRQNGVGQYVDTSMLDGAVSWLPVLANDFFVKGVSPRAAENILNGQNACYEVYETADGRYISIGAIEPHLWANFCNAIGREDFIQMQRDLTKQDEMFAYLRELFKSKTQAEWIEKLTGVDCCWAPVKDLEESSATRRSSHATWSSRWRTPRRLRPRQGDRLPHKALRDPRAPRALPPEKGRAQQRLPQIRGLHGRGHSRVH